MCTVSFLPKGGNDFIITSDRDEKESREIALAPKQFIHQHLKVVYPQDTKAKGTWIAMSENGFSICLLNGGFMPHKSNPPYRKSRGIVLLDFFEFNNVNQFVINYDFKKIEPFTMIIVDYKSSLKLYEIRWDGKQAHLSVIDPKVSHIWSSVTLYTPEVRREREMWFNEWKKSKSHGYEPEDVIDFHLTGGIGDKETDIMMRRAGTYTVSITQIVKADKEVVMNYKDLIKTTNSVMSLALSK